jgi:hypothetical protein
VVLSFRKRIGQVLNLLTQVLVVAIWITLLVGIAMGPRDPIPADMSFAVRFIAMLMFFWELAGAAGTIFWFFRQFAHAKANARFLAWLKANEAKIRNNELAFYRSKRITLNTVLVRHHLVCSAMFLTGRMTTRWLVLGQEPRLRHALGASLYSFWNGWWGFPFGLIWTPIAIIRNLTGSPTITVEDLLRVPPPPPLGLQGRLAANLKETTKELILAD